MATRLGALGLLGVVLVGCRATGVTDYRAIPAAAEQDWGDRLHLRRGGVRVVAGPASVFPYTVEGPDGERVRGRYQLFTRLMVHNVGDAPVEVLWGGAVLEGPDGVAVGLEDTGLAAGRGGGGGDARAGLVERLEPGHRTARALIPRTVHEIGVGEPLVPLCDGCEYRLVLPVRIAGREERLELRFRLRTEQPLSSGWGRFGRSWGE